MDNVYHKSKEKLENFIYGMKKMVEQAPSKTFEDEMICRKLEGLVEKMDDVVYAIEHYSKPAREGTLRKIENGKFDLIDAGGKSIAYFSCGSSIECELEYDGELEWFAGRVEYRDGGYYFYGADKPYLYNGMKARVRR